MKVIIVGASGLVGYSLWREWTKPEFQKKGWEVFGTYFKHGVGGLDPLDLLDAAAVKSYIDRISPEVVVIASANPFVDYCEAHPMETKALNVDATIKTAEAAAEHKAKVVFFSSEYVFAGQQAPYNENSKMNPLSEYGRQKMEVEQWMRLNLEDFLVLRIAGVYGWALPNNAKNFVLQMLNCSAKHEKIFAATDVSYNPTYAVNLGPVLAELLGKNARGIYHAAGEQAMSRHEFAKDIADAFGFDRGIIQPIDYKTLSSKQPARRPQYAAFNTDKIQETVKARLWGPRQALEHMKATEKEWSA